MPDPLLYGLTEDQARRYVEYEEKYSAARAVRKEAILDKYWLGLKGGKP